MRTPASLLAAFALIAVAAPATASASGSSKSSRAVVIVSGGGAISPFTTPTRACKTGYAAGNTDTFMRSYFLKRGYRVFTSPAMAGRGKVVEQPGEGGPFGKCPKALPSYMTVNSAGDIELAGTSLAAFVRFLNRKHGVKEIDFVAHSMGGLFSRSAIHYLQETGSPVKIRSLNTMGTPWGGAIFGDSPDPGNPKAACDGFAVCEALIDVFGSRAPVILTEMKSAYMAELNNDNAGVLKKIPVTMVAGDYFQKDGGTPRVWPNDGIVTVDSAMARAASDAVINHRRCHLLPGGTHSIYISKEVGLPDDTGITWNNQVGAWLLDAIRNSSKALRQPNRVGCPSA